MFLSLEGNELSPLIHDVKRENRSAAETASKWNEFSCENKVLNLLNDQEKIRRSKLKLETVIFKLLFISCSRDAFVWTGLQTWRKST